VVCVRLLEPSATNLGLWNAHITEPTVDKGGRPKSRQLANNLTMVDLSKNCKTRVGGYLYLAGKLSPKFGHVQPIFAESLRRLRVNNVIRNS
jgi:hypothetical protein